MLVDALLHQLVKIVILGPRTNVLERVLPFIFVEPLERVLDAGAFAREHVPKLDGEFGGETLEFAPIFVARIIQFERSFHPQRRRDWSIDDESIAVSTSLRFTRDLDSRDVVVREIAFNRQRVSTPRARPLGKIRHGHAIIFHRLRVIGSVIVDFGANTAQKTSTHRAERRRRLMRE